MSILNNDLINKLFNEINLMLINNNSDDLIDDKNYKNIFQYKIVNENFFKKIFQQSNAFDSWLNNNVDVIPNVYEGGLKIWEGLFDLINFLNNDDIFNKYFNLNNDNESIINICDLGCGSGLLSIFLAKKLKKLNKKFNIYLQDFNEEVLKFFTIPNIIINNIDDDLNNFNFIYGNWINVDRYFQENQIKLNLILTSETIYEPKNFDNLIQLFLNNINTNDNDGNILIASKSHYFGIGGGTYSFLDYIDDQNNILLKYKIVNEIDQTLLRHIIQLNLNQSS